MDGGATIHDRHSARWVHTWVAMPQAAEPDNLPPPPFRSPERFLANTTLRQTVRVSLGGARIRIRLSNAFGTAPLPITAVSVATPVGGQAGVSAIEPGSAQPVTFHGRSRVVIPVGAQIVSDPLDFPLAPRSNLTVTVYLAEGQAAPGLTSHPGSRTTSYLLAGNHVDATDLTGATPVEHWYVISGVEVCHPHGAAAVILGDSLTDGRGSTTDGNNRWPDRLVDRLHAHPRYADIAVLNQGAGGNRVLNDGLGPNALARLDRDVLALSGVRWLVVFEGINDIGTAPATPTGQEQVAEELIAAYEQIIVRCHAHGIRVYGATLLPFGGNPDYDDPNGLRDATRRTVNEWIRTSGHFDAVIDLDLAARDPQDPRRLHPAVDCGDHLHLNPTGYQVLADAVPLELFDVPASGDVPPHRPADAEATRSAVGQHP